tara:strand:+ start:60 stop:179 length:120 start_codon:yes stop_codon:yes gene_type:complete
MKKTTKRSRKKRERTTMETETPHPRSCDFVRGVIVNNTD